MDTIFQEEFLKQEHDTEDDVTFEYQKGYSDAMKEFGDLDREVHTLMFLIFVVFMILLIHFLHRLRI